MSYHGYLIRTTLTGDVHIEKGGHHIAWATDIDDAKRQIDELRSTTEAGQ